MRTSGALLARAAGGLGRRRRTIGRAGGAWGRCLARGALHGGRPARRRVGVRGALAGPQAAFAGAPHPALSGARGRATRRPGGAPRPPPPSYRGQKKRTWKLLLSLMSTVPSPE